MVEVCARVVGYLQQSLSSCDQADEALARAGDGLVRGLGNAEFLASLPPAFLAGVASTEACLNDIAPWELCSVDFRHVVAECSASEPASQVQGESAVESAAGLFNAKSGKGDAAGTWAMLTRGAWTILMNTRVGTLLVLPETGASEFGFAERDSDALKVCSAQGEVLSDSLHTRATLEGDEVQRPVSKIKSGCGSVLSSGWCWGTWRAVTIAPTSQASLAVASISLANLQWPSQCSLLLTDVVRLCVVEEDRGRVACVRDSVVTRV